MTTLLFAAGLLIGVVLVSLLLVTFAWSGLQLWPTPGPKTWQSYVFWPLFRGLNVLTFATAIAAALSEYPRYLGLPGVVRMLAFVALLASLGCFLYAFFALGRDNSYGAQDGLVTGGIYQWTRNPQNAMLVVVYGALALAADNVPTYATAAAMMAVYALMVLCEEPWLEKIYGEPYRAYCRQVPRFFHWRRLVAKDFRNK